MKNAWKPLVLLLLLGCATDEPPKSSGPKPFPAPPPPQYTLLFFYTQRHDSVKAHPTLYIDGTRVTKLPNDSYTWCHVTPGWHVVRALWGDADAALNQHRDIEFKAGESMFLRLITKGHQLAEIKLATAATVDSVPADLARSETENSIYEKARKDVVP